MGSFFSAALLLLCVCKCVPFILSTVQDYLHETMLESVRPRLLIKYMNIGRDDHCNVLFPRSVLHYVHHCTLILQSTHMCVYVSQGFSQYTECVHGLVPGLVPHSLLDRCFLAEPDTTARDNCAVAWRHRGESPPATYTYTYIYGNVGDK